MRTPEGHSFSETRANGETADEVYARLKHHVDPHGGIVRGIYPSIWNDKTPIRLFTAAHNFSFCADQIEFLRNASCPFSFGKGRTIAQARASALCEALERYSGVFHGNEFRASVRFGELPNSVHPNDLMLFSDNQYRDRDKWLRTGSWMQAVPLPFDAESAIEWSPVRSLTGEIKHVPTSFLYYGYPKDPNTFCCWADSNGNAAGDTYESALLEGIFEVIERDSVSIWWFNRARRPEVDLNCFHDDYFAELSDFYARLGREFWLLDVTTDTEIPTFAAINRRTSGPAEDIVMGFGAHVSPHTAAVRAVTEMNQGMPAVLNVYPDGTTEYPTYDADALRWWQTAVISNQEYLVPSGISPLNYGALSTSAKGSTRQWLDRCIDVITELGMEILVHDQTRPDVGLSVVKVIIPGLRNTWARFAPGRLYDVPVRLGWFATPVPEAELNTVPVVL